MAEQVTINRTTMSDADFAKVVALRPETIHPDDKAVVLDFLRARRETFARDKARDSIGHASAAVRATPNADRLMWLRIDPSAPRLIAEG